MEGKCYDIQEGLKGIGYGWVELLCVTDNGDRWLL